VQDREIMGGKLYNELYEKKKEKAYFEPHKKKKQQLSAQKRVGNAGT
jgi:hypothetical protein